MAWLFIITSYLLFELNSSVRGEWGQIKINEPREQYSSNSYGYQSDNSYGNSGSSSGSSSSYRDPHSETENSDLVASSIVEYLTGRKGEIVEGTHDKYTYKIDLFNKVEQSENWYSWNLGIFDKWDVCDTTNTEICLHYTDGQICGNGHGRSSHVHIVCDIDEDKNATKEHLYDITEPMTCSYHMNMYIPRICELLNHDISTIFAGDNPNVVSVTELPSAVVGDTSGLLNKLNEIVAQKNDDKELDYLWKLCLLSLMVDDETKLNTIRSVASVLMLQYIETVVPEEDVEANEKAETEICDFYLERMLSLKEEETSNADVDETMETTMSNKTDIENDVEDDALEVEEDMEYQDLYNENDNKIGGLIGAILNKKIDKSKYDVPVVEDDDLVINGGIDGYIEEEETEEAQRDEIGLQSEKNRDQIKQNDMEYDVEIDVYEMDNDDNLVGVDLEENDL
eukprot:403232_1